jgi:tetratricopeptide (TPR) repeat protein
MSDSTDWKQKQLESVRSLLADSQQAFQQGNLPVAGDCIDEALIILDMAEAEGVDDTVRQVKARALNDRGLFHQHSDEPDQARPYHKRAADLLDELDAIEGEFQTTATAIHLNVGQIALFDEDYAAARKATDKALELVDGLVDSGLPGAESLAMGVHQNKAALEGQSGNFDSAAEAAETALELAEQLAEAGNPAALGQAARICQQFSVQLHQAGNYDRSIEWGERAEELSERTYNQLGDQALDLYIVSQINLISYYEQSRRFADAEDALWKAIDVAGANQELIERGQAFYEQCRKQSDKRLEQGNLPRDEVKMGYEDLQELVD